MNKDTAKACTVAGIILIVLLSLAIPYVDGIYTIILISNIICFAIPFVILGMAGLYENKNNNNEKHVKERAAATMFSAMPGLGHIYLKRYVKGIFYMVLFLIFAAIFVIGIILYSDDYYCEYTNAATIYYTYGLIMAFFIWIWSYVDIASICNDDDLPYMEETLELRCKRTDLATSILFMTTSILLIAASAIMIYFDITISNLLNMVVIVLSIILLIPMSYKYLKDAKLKNKFTK